jgi:Dolichyl-phosphate-mannose-protein mannosyltransferase
LSLNHIIGKVFAFAGARFLRARPRQLLLAAAGLHVLTALAIYTAGQLSILPYPFVSSDIGQFAFDSFWYQQEARTLAGVLSNDGVAAWLGTPFPLHLRLYSLSLAVFSPLFGYSVLAVEPLNLFYYLASVVLVYRIGKEAFGKETGLLSAIVIAVWPSFLLHTTQFLKDPLFIVCMLALAFVCTVWLAKICSWKAGVLTGVLGAASLAVLARLKSNMWASVVVLLVIGLILLVARQVSARRIFAQNLLSAALIVTFALVMPVKETEVHRRDQTAIENLEQAGESTTLWTLLGVRIAERRRVFNLSSGPRESNIDAELYFRDTADIVRYLPRATLIGLFAPFPPMWLTSGTSGRAAHLLSGAETLLFYLIVLAAGACVYVERRNFCTWFLLTVALANIIALALVVTNIGTLLRLRYVFWMLIIIIGARGLIILAHKFRD